MATNRGGMLPLNLSRDPAAPLQMLCLGAHSDDIEIGCGGTILQLLSGYSNVDVVWVVFSSGRGTRTRSPHQRGALSQTGQAQESDRKKISAMASFLTTGQRSRNSSKKIKKSRTLIRT